MGFQITEFNTSTLLPADEGDDVEPFEYESFEVARRMLMDILFAEANTVAWQFCAQHIGEDACRPGCACDYDNAAQDVNLWLTPQTLKVGDIEYGIEAL